MRRVIGRRGLRLLALLMPLLVLPGAAVAVEPPPPAMIAILDVNEVMQKSVAAKDIRRQIEAYRKSYQGDIKRAEDKLREQEESLKRQRASLAPDVFAKRRRAFEKEVITLQRKVRDRTKALDRAYSKAMAELRKPLGKLIKDLSREQGYNVVIDNRHIFIKLDGYDITDMVVKHLDKTVPKVKVAKPPE